MTAQTIIDEPNTNPTTPRPQVPSTTNDPRAPTPSGTFDLISETPAPVLKTYIPSRIPEVTSAKSSNSAAKQQAVKAESYWHKASNWFNAALKTLFEPARTANALGNGAISAGAIKTHMGVLILGLITGMINSYAAGEAKPVDKIINASTPLWWADRLIALIYGLGCGLTTAASAHQIFLTLASTLGSVYGLIGFAFILGFITFISARAKMGNLSALILATAIAAIYIGIAFALITTGASLAAPILFASTYILSVILGTCTTILNYAITQESIIEIVMRLIGKKIDYEKPVNEDQDLKNNKPQEPELPRTLRQEVKYKILLAFTSASAIVSGLAIGGLTYISILWLPGAFGFFMPLPALVTLAAFIAVVTTLALTPMLIKQAIPVAEEWSKISLSGIPTLFKDKFKELFIFDPTRYKDTWTNRCKFYTKSILLILLIPLAIIGSILTMMQASGALSEVIKGFLQSVRLVAASQEDEISDSMAYSALGVALLSDVIFCAKTTRDWARTNIVQLENAPRVHHYEKSEGNSELSSKPAPAINSELTGVTAATSSTHHAADTPKKNGATSPLRTTPGQEGSKTPKSVLVKAGFFPETGVKRRAASVGILSQDGRSDSPSLNNPDPASAVPSSSAH